MNPFVAIGSKGRLEIIHQDKQDVWSINSRSCRTPGAIALNQHAQDASQQREPELHHHVFRRKALLSGNSYTLISVNRFSNNLSLTVWKCDDNVTASPVAKPEMGDCFLRGGIAEAGGDFPGGDQG